MVSGTNPVTPIGDRGREDERSGGNGEGEREKKSAVLTQLPSHLPYLTPQFCTNYELQSQILSYRNYVEHLRTIVKELELLMAKRSTCLHFFGKEIEWETAEEENKREFSVPHSIAYCLKCGITNKEV